VLTPGIGAQSADSTGPATFIVLLRGARVGTETVTLSRVGSDWQFSGTGRLAPPFDVVTNRFEMTYASDWQPTKLALQGTVRGQGVSLTTSFGLTTAMNEFMQGMQRGASSHQLLPRSLVLPSTYFASYEALAARIGTVAPGTRLPVYVAPEGQTSLTVSQMTPRRLSLGERTLDIRAYTVTLASAGTSSTAEVWVDSQNRLARLEMPSLAVVVIREDLASVMAREVRLRNPRDEDTFIPANGFSLGATTTRPATVTAPTGAKPAKSPAVILVGGAGPQDRDFSTYGVSIFGQLAGSLSNSGYFVVRYDGRGVGRSGGRTENATLAEYADDVIRVVEWLRRRQDIDEKRIAVVAYGDGGPVALAAASKQSRIAAVGLLATPGRTGREVTIDQQTQLLSQLALPESERAARIDLQHRVVEATLTGKGWETIPPEVKSQAQTPWFKSWLLFDPAGALKKMKQPLLIVHPALDKENSPQNADNLEALSRQRNKLPPTHTKKIVLPELNHLLVPASSGSVSEYSSLMDLTVAPAVSVSLSEWLATAIPAAR
jgi:pimeloyl-ACP methyl ester carboxylesterase